MVETRSEYCGTNNEIVLFTKRGGQNLVRNDLNVSQKPFPPLSRYDRADAASSMLISFRKSSVCS